MAGRALVHGHAIVTDSAHVGDDSRVFDHAVLRGQCSVRGDSTVHDSAELNHYARVNNSHVFGRSKLHDYAAAEEAVIDNAELYGNTQANSGALLSGGAWHDCGCIPVIRGILDFAANVSAPGLIRVGCQEHDLSAWFGADSALEIVQDHLDMDELPPESEFWMDYIAVLAKWDLRMRMAGKLRDLPQP